MSEQIPRTRALQAFTRWLGRLTLLAFALLVLGSIVVAVILPRATHGTALTVWTGSMTPEISVGSIVVVRPVDPSTLRVGDVATYQVAPDQRAFITHRIIDVNHTTSPVQFTFKGDANPGPDVNPVPAGAIRGKVWFHVPYLGAIRDALHGKGGISLVAMLVLAGYAMTQLSGAFKDRKKRAGIIDTGVSPMASRTSLHVPLDRAVIVAELPCPEDCEDRPAYQDEIARCWRGVVLHAGTDTLTLLLAPPRDGVGAAQELLREAGATTELWQPDTGPTSASPALPSLATSKVTERVQS